MPWVELNDGRRVTTKEDIPPEVLDSVAIGIEAGGAVPKGFTLQPPPSPSTEQVGARKTTSERFQELGQSANSAVQTAREYAGPILESARGKATRGLAIGAGVMQAAPAMMQHLTGEPTIPEAGENATTIAKNVVPQTASDLLTTLALGATSKIPGMGGVLARLASTAGGDMAGKYLAGEEQNLRDTALKTGVTGAVEVGGMLAPHLGKQVREVVKENQGRVDTQALGAAFAKHTNLKYLDTPEALSGALTGSKFIHTGISKEVSRAIEENEQKLISGVKQTMASLPSQQLQTAIPLLEKAADITPPKVVGFQSPGTQTIQRQNTPDQLVEMAIKRLRHIREDINHSIDAAGTTGTVGMSTYDLNEKYKGVRDVLTAGLTVMDPQLADQYNLMNSQYVKDFDLAKFLYMGRDSFLTTGLHSSKALTPEFGTYVAQNVGDIRDGNLVADILKITTRGGEFGAADQAWTIGSRFGGPKTQGGTIALPIALSGQTPARARTTTQNMPPMGVYDIGALKGLTLAEDEMKRK